MGVCLMISATRRSKSAAPIMRRRPAKPMRDKINRDENAAPPSFGLIPLPVSRFRATSRPGRSGENDNRQAEPCASKA